MKVDPWQREDQNAETKTPDVKTKQERGCCEVKLQGITNECRDLGEVKPWRKQSAEEYSGIRRHP